MEKSKKKKFEDICSKVLKEIKPSQLEIASTTANVNEIMGRLKEIVPKDIEIMVVGSIARGTNLSGNSDIDIFLLFNKDKYTRGEIIKKGLKYAKDVVNKKKNERAELRYAEHPYTRLYLDDKNLKIDVVPAFKIEKIEEMGTTVDRTPLHTEFINSRLSPKQKDDVRLLKYLLMSHNIYGAEVKTKGFSGYLCELLIYSFGSLINLLEWASQMKIPICIYPSEKRYDSNGELVRKFNSQFIVVDPVDPNRNVAAGVAIETLARFILLARMMISNPSIRLFYGRGFSSSHVHSLIRDFEKRSGLEPYTIIAKVSNKSEDIVWPQLNKIGEIIEVELNKEGFNVEIRITWIKGTKGFIAFFLSKAKIIAKLIKGPNVFVGSFSDNFIKKHSKALAILVRGSIVYALEKSKHRTAEEFLKWLIKRKKVARKKDVILSGTKIIHGIPREYAEDAYSELLRKIYL